jgi:hypothetical protein
MLLPGSVVPPIVLRGNIFVVVLAITEKELPGTSVQVPPKKLYFARLYC